MIVGVRGLIEAVGPDWIHLQVGGVTLQVYVPATAIGELGPVGSTAHLYTHFRLREEIPTLYGFPSSQALELFLLLMNVSGVGPRLGLSLLSGLGAERLQQAIVAADVAALSSVSGVGRRIASRIALELKGKLEADETGAMPLTAGSDDSEVVAALTALGYTSAEARQAVSNLDKAAGLSVEERIRLALQQFGAGR